LKVLTIYLLDKCVGVEPDWNDPCMGVGLNPSICTTGLGSVNGTDAALDASSLSESAFLESSSNNRHNY